MSWQRINAEDLSRYQRVLETEAVYRGGSGVDGLRKLLDRGAELWLYDASVWWLALSLWKRPDGRVKIVNCVPAGRTTGRAAVRVAIDKIRERVDALGCTEFDGELAPSYSSPVMREFARQIGRVVWELNDDRSVANGRRRISFFREASRRAAEDKRYIGPEVAT